MSSSENRKPADFDWVSVRSKCSVREMFEQLRFGVKQDVAAINSRPKNTSSLPHDFKVFENGKVIKVFEDDPFLDSGPSVLFSLSGNLIRIIDGEDNALKFEVSIGLNDEGDCRFIVGGKECDSWQIRRKALEGLFFRV